MCKVKTPSAHDRVRILPSHYPRVHFALATTTLQDVLAPEWPVSNPPFHTSASSVLVTLEISEAKGKHPRLVTTHSHPPSRSTRVFRPPTLLHTREY